MNRFIAFKDSLGLLVNKLAYLIKTSQKLLLALRDSSITQLKELAYRQHSFPQ